MVGTSPSGLAADRTALENCETVGMTFMVVCGAGVRWGGSQTRPLNFLETAYAGSEAASLSTASWSIAWLSSSLGKLRDWTSATNSVTAP